MTNLPESGFSRDRRALWRVKQKPRGAGFGLSRFWTALISLAVLTVVLSVGGGAVIELIDWLNPPPKGPLVESAGDKLQAHFSICAGEVRFDCVVDGDTFWFRGEKIRLSDVDAPEIYPPHCDREAELGQAAKRRLRELLNGGRFSLEEISRDRDRYGRELRRVTRGGRSIGDVLAAEGLARRMHGARESWCG